MPVVLLDPGQILQVQLSRSLGLDKYAKIIHGDLQSPAVQRLFNGYYRVRRNDQWRQIYYELFRKAKSERYSFAQIITALYQATGNVEASYSSKMLATIDPNQPIWDQYVLHNLGLVLTGKTQKEKLDNAILLYGEIDRWYREFLETDDGRECIRTFDRWLPSYSWITSVKKID